MKSFINLLPKLIPRNIFKKKKIKKVHFGHGSKMIYIAPNETWMRYFLNDNVHEFILNEKLNESQESTAEYCNVSTPHVK